MTIGELHFLYGVIPADMAVLCDMVERGEIGSTGMKTLSLMMFDHRDPWTRGRMVKAHGPTVAHALFAKLDSLPL